MKKLLLSILTIGTIMSCSSTAENKVLVLYYSQTGTTKAVAEEIQRQLGADIECFDVEEPYTGSFMETVARNQQETAQGVVPALVPVKADLSKYDLIFLGYPIWSGTYATPVKALLNSVDLSGKTIVTFCSFGSGGLNTSTADLAKALPDSKVVEGYGVRTARVASAAEELERFLIENGYKEGEAEALPEFSAPAPVTEEEAAIFNAACSDYQFPLGTPTEAGSRKTSKGVDYIFKVDNGSTIYVTVGDGKEPEFTQVVR